MSTCVAVRYDTPEAAKAARKQYLRDYHLATNVYMCNNCESFHVVGNKSRIRLPKKAWEVLRLVAMGYSLTEISKNTGLNWYTARWYVEELRAVFDALNSAHLVCIAMRLGVLDPNEFVPPLVERTHAHDGHGHPSEHIQRQTMQRDCPPGLLPGDGVSA